jgi:phosphatidylinositol alpha-1,6-mannosyltransferase
MPQKYLLATLEFPPQKGGVATLYKSYYDYWPDGELFVLANNSLGLQDFGKVKFHNLISNKIWPRWLPAFCQLWREVKKADGNINIIVGQILPLGIAAYYLSKFLKFKYTVLSHGMDFSLATATKRKKKITKKILQRADKIICSNSYTANSVKVFDDGLAVKLGMVNPGIESSFVRNPQRVEELRSKYGLQNKLVLLSLGRLTRRKGVDNVIKAMDDISKSAADLVYVVAGAGQEAEALKKIVAAKPEEIKNKIIFLGQISDEDRWAWLELCDIFITPSRNINGDYEGFGIVYLEANLAGKPVIAGDSGGVRDAVINNINGLLVNPESVAEIAAAVLKLSSDEKLRKEIGNQGKRRAVENFNAKKQVEKIFKILK